METKRDTFAVAHQAFKKHRALHSLAHYTGILSLQGLAHLALNTRDPDVLAECHEILLPFVRGERRFKANFTNYFCGGNATALLFWSGELPEAKEAVRHYAEDLMVNAQRDEGGIVSMPNRPRRDMIWIDAAFAVSPFLLFAGLAFQEEAYVEEGYQQISKMVAVLRDPDSGLLHQSRGFAAPGKLSEDHWSRGNGWGLLALSELVRYLPDDDPRRPEAEQIFTDLIQACLRVQDEDGMWHQELTDPTAYVETSGTGLILYAIGVGLEQALLPEAALDDLLRGLESYLLYIQEDDSVFHTCRGCLCPGEGRILDYKARAPLLNDPHAFGPVTLAFGQAVRLGIETVTPGRIKGKEARGGDDRAGRRCVGGH